MENARQTCNTDIDASCRTPTGASRGERRAQPTFYGYRKSGDELPRDPDHLLIVFLKFHDGLWTTSRFEWSDPEIGGSRGRTTYFLLDAIDEAAEKK
jgi:hypothetical protein